MAELIVVASLSLLGAFLIAAISFRIGAGRNRGRPYGSWIRFYGRVISAEVNLGKVRKLWVVPIGMGEVIQVLEVTNHTPEPDGSFKSYWLGVPWHVRTAHDAAAWTYGIRSDVYWEHKRT